ncbi:unnamed protein product [Rotaria sordida]|uniref:DNA ligase 3 n=1 Tax=Rotaria sordida TaxID=392033 RepID=A0A814UIA6_9BILA|nr:unnamed protein product [Rotaria sordida]
MLFKSQCNQYQWNINDHNGIFFFGDLNYRQTVTNQDELIEKTNILKTYSESDIKFPPTYKFKANSNSYDLSRRPSWTDRILYRAKQCYIESINYWTTSMIQFSDHRPIANLFLLRCLKPVIEHKIEQISQYVLKAFPKGESLILDGEILLIDRKTRKPLPFGTLGVHKKKEFTEANEAFFIFDCLYYNGQSLLHKTLTERREILTEHMKPIENRILLSELKTINKKSDLKHLINFTIAEGLEGLVLKNPDGIYEPNKRHWLKVKKDYLMEGTMADTADLVVLGAYYGTGKKGGLMSVFLLGCYDSKTDQWYTVAKCGSGFDDATLEKLQIELKPNMTKISKNPNQIPKWLNISRDLIPDFIVIDPKKSPVWEITVNILSFFSFD